jgi:polysaccharide export outer membrane protein
MKRSKLLEIALFAVLISLLSSCKVQNLLESSNKETDNSDLFSAESREYEYLIRAEDKLSISIWGHDDLSVGSVFGIYNSNEVYGKWVRVHQNGNVVLPQIGELSASGKTTQELSALLKEKYARFIQDPIIVVKVLNKRVSLLGAVKQASSFTLDEDKIPLLDLIGRGEGFDYYADRSQVKLVRKTNGLSREYILDLTQMESYAQCDVLIRPGDVVYVPFKNGKAFDKKTDRILPFVGILSSLSILISVLK